VADLVLGDHPQVEIAKGWATGSMPDLGTMHEVKAK